MASILVLADALIALTTKVNFLVNSPVAEHLDAVARTVGQTDGTKRRFIHPRAILKLVQITDIHGQIMRGKFGVIKTPLGYAANQRHLTAFKTNADRTAGTGGLALAATASRFAMTGRFALTKPLAAMFRAGTGFQIV